MFNILTNAIENALDVTGDLLSGELPTNRQVAQLINDGLTVAAIASAAGVAESVIEGMIDDV